MNHEVEKRIGKNLRTLREKADMTQDELACALQLRGCDITRSAVAKLEVAQRHLYVDEIILLKEILDTNYEELLA
ncbi:MAG: helix-turn-helix transcriptional regulator [Clostridia bacterium]|nr:helix-turn-helix transcriptional regulator [Clostridia bacterium]MBP3371145.1 helix-turn-helix transcriptional regulator [Clostridia bacterium]